MLTTSRTASAAFKTRREGMMSAVLDLKESERAGELFHLVGFENVAFFQVVETF